MGINLYWGKSSISILHGDITDQDVDAIVNAANPSLTGGRGIDGAIHERGGNQLLDECLRIRRVSWPNGLPPGYAVMTKGGLLKARNVIHTVGPIWKGGGWNEANLLRNCYINCLRLTQTHKLKSIAFPSISTGYYGYPIQEASTVALESTREFVERNRWPPKVIFVLYNDFAFELYKDKALTLH